MTFILRVGFAFALLLAFSAKAQTTFYWVGNSGSLTDGSHWSLSGGGAPCFCLPDSSSDIVFNSASTTQPNQVISLPQNASFRVRSIDFTGLNDSLNFTLDYYSALFVKGSLLLHPKLKITSSLSSINFTSTDTSNVQIIDTKGINLQNTNLMFNHSGKWQLNSPINNAGQLSFNSGSFNSNNFEIRAGTFYCYFPTSTVKVDLGTSTLFFDNWYTVSNTLNRIQIDCDSTLLNVLFNLQLSGEKLNRVMLNSYYPVVSSFYRTSTIKYVSSTGNFQLSLQDSLEIDSIYSSGNISLNLRSTAVSPPIKYLETNGNLSINSPSNTKIEKSVVNGNINLISNATIDTVLCGASKQLTILYGSTLTSKFLSASGNCTSLFKLEGGYSNSIGFINLQNGSAQLNYCSIKNLAFTSTNPIIANESFDFGNNSGIQFQNSIGSRTLYWVGGSGLFRDPANWSLTSGGPSVSCPPTSIDNVILDANSVASGPISITIDTDVQCHSFTATNINQAATIGGYYSLIVFGSFHQNNFLNFSSGVNLKFISIHGGNTLNFGGTTFPNNIFFESPSGSWQLISNLKCLNTIFLESGSLNLNGYTMDASLLATFQSFGHYPKTLICNNSVLKLRSGINYYNTTGLNIQSANSLLVLGDSASNFYSGNINSLDTLVFNDVIINSDNSTLNGFHRFRNISAKKNIYCYGSITADSVVATSFYIQDFYNSSPLRKIKYLYVRDYFELIKSNTSPQSFGKLVIKGNGTLTGSATIDSLILSPGKTYNFSGSYSLMMLSAQGKCDSIITLRGIGSTSINLNSNTIFPEYINCRGIQFLNSSGSTAQNSNNLGNTSGLLFNSPTPNTYYWVGGSGSWFDGSNWSFTSGGSPAFCVPNIRDNAVFDDNSTGGDTITVQLENSDTVYVRNIISTGSMGAVNVSSNWNKLCVKGTLNLQKRFTFNQLNSVVLNADSGTLTVDVANTIFNCNVNLSSNATYNLINTLRIEGAYNIFQLQSGTLKINQANIFANSIVINTSVMLKAYFGYARIETRTFENYLTSSNVTTDSATLIISDKYASQPIWGNGAVYTSQMKLRVFISNTNSSLYASTFTADTIYFRAGFQHYMNSTVLSSKIFTLGACGSTARLINGHYLNKISGDTIYVQNVTLQNVNCTNGVAINSVNFSGSPNWIYRTMPTSSLYWVNGGGNWSDPAHWSFSNGGIPGACIPTTFNNVLFTSTSFPTPGANAVVLDSNAFCRNMQWMGVTNNPVFDIQSSLSISEGLSFSAGMTSIGSGTLNLTSLFTNTAVDLAGIPLMADLTFDGTGGWDLNSALNTEGSFSLIKGTFNSQSYSITCKQLLSSNSNNRNLLLDSSTINVKDMWDMQDSTNLSLSAINTTINVSGDQAFFYGGNKQYNEVNFTSPNGYSGVIGLRNHFKKVTFASSGAVIGYARIDTILAAADFVSDYAFFSMFASDSSIFGKVSVDGRFQAGFAFGDNTSFNSLRIGGDGSLYKSNKIDSLFLSPGKTYQFGGGKLQNIGYLEANGTCNSKIVLQSTTAGQPAELASTGNVQVNHCVIDNVNASGATFTATNSVLINPANGWTSTTPTSSRQLYWIGGSGEWNDPNHWSESSGGPPVACGPTIHDDVYFDVNSFSTTNGIVDLTSDGFCHSMDWTGSMYNPTFKNFGNQSLTISGDLILTNNLYFDFYGPLRFITTDSLIIINLAGKTLTNNLIFRGNTFSIANALTTYENIELHKGTLNLNNNPITSNSFKTFNNNICTIANCPAINVSDTSAFVNLQSTSVNTINVDGNFGYVTADSGIHISKLHFQNAPFSIGTLNISGTTEIDTLLFDAEAELNGLNTSALLSSRVVNLASNSIIKSSVSIDSLNIRAPYSYQFEAGKIYTFSKINTLNGSCNSLASLTGFGQGGALFNTADTLRVKFVSLQNIYALIFQRAYRANSSVDLGNNSGWVFNSEKQPGVDLYWVGGTGMWNDNSHWSFSSGGPGGACIPSISDNVFFDQNSFSSTFQSVNLTFNAQCNNISFSGINYSPYINGDTLKIAGNALLHDSLHLSIANVFFNSTDSNSLDLRSRSTSANFSFSGGGKWRLNSGIKTNGNIRLINGHLNLNSNVLECNELSALQGSLNMTNSVVNVIQNFGVNSPSFLSLLSQNSIINLSSPFSSLSVGPTPQWLRNGINHSFNIVNFTSTFSHTNGSVQSDSTAFNKLFFNGSGTINGYINADTVISNDQLTINGSGSNITYCRSGGYFTEFSNPTIKFGKLILLSDGTFYGPIETDTLFLRKGYYYIFNPNKTYTIKRIEDDGNCSKRIQISTLSQGSSATINAATNNLTINYSLIQDIELINGSLTAYNSIDLGGNTNISFQPNTITDLYWVGNSGNWSDSTHWSFTSGGPGGACIPSPNDNVHFDSNSFSQSGQTVVLDINGYCRNIDWTGCLAGNQLSYGFFLLKLNVFGSLTLSNGIINSSLNMKFLSNTSASILSAGVTIGGIEFAGSGDFHITDNLLAGNIKLYNGNVIADSRTMTIGSLEIGGSSLKSFSFSNGNMNVSDVTVFNAQTLSADFTNSSIQLSGFNSSLNVNGGPVQFNRIAFTNPNGYLFISSQGNVTADSVTSLGSISINGSVSINHLSSQQDYYTYNSNPDDTLPSIYGNILVGGITSINRKSEIEKLTASGNCNINSSNTIDSLILAPGSTCKFDNNQIQSIGFIRTNGNCGNLTKLESNNNGNHALIKALNPIVIHHAEIKDISVIQGTVFAFGSINAGNNSGNITISGTLIEVCGDGIDNDCDSLIDEPCNFTAQVQLKLFIEGFYLGNDSMIAAADQLNGITDTIIVRVFRNSQLETAFYSDTVLLSVNGSTSLTIPNASGSEQYYFVINHRNSLETWSTMVMLTQNFTYDFTNTANKAYGNNLIELSPGHFGIISGDVNQNGIIDGTDHASIDLSCLNFFTGWTANDLTGDRIVESADNSIVENNLGKILIRP